MTNNIVDRIGSKVTVWSMDGNSMENRKLLTLDTFGVVVTQYNSDDVAVFVPWCQVKYIDYANSQAKTRTVSTDSVSAFTPPTV